MAKLSDLISKSNRQLSEINVNYQQDSDDRAEMRAKIFSRPGSVNTNSNNTSPEFDANRIAKKLDKIQKEDKILDMYTDRVIGNNNQSNSDALLNKANSTSFDNKINVDNYESKILERLNSTKRIFTDLITKVGEKHPVLLIKNSTFGGIVMNPVDNLLKLFDKLNQRNIPISSNAENKLVNKIDPGSYDFIMNKSTIDSKLNKLTYNMSIDEMSDLMSELLLTRDIKYNFNTPNLLSLSKNSRPIVISDGNSLLSLYNKENFNYAFNTNYIDNNFNTKYSTVNYFKDTYAPGFIEKAKELQTFFKNLNNINNSSVVDYLPNTYANGFTSNFISGRSLYKDKDGVEIGEGIGFKDGIVFANPSSRLENKNYFPDTYADGFIGNSIRLFSQYKRSDVDAPLGLFYDSISATFANPESRLGSVDYFPNTHAYGFVTGLNSDYSYFNNSKDGKSRSDIGFGIDIKNNITPSYNVNWIVDEYAKGFVDNAVPLYSYYMDISRNLLGKDESNQAVMFKNESSWLKIQNNFNDRYADGFDANSRFHYSYYKMKNGNRLGILNNNIVGFFDSEYKYPDIKFPNNNDYRSFDWQFNGNPILMQIPGNSEYNVLLGQTNFFSNIYNVGFISNKEYGESDYDNYGTPNDTYSDLMISGLFETIDLESKIGSSLYGNVSAVDYLNNQFARGFILNATKGYSYIQYKQNDINKLDIGYLANSILDNTKYEYPQMLDRYNNIRAKFNDNINVLKFSTYKYDINFDGAYEVLGRNSYEKSLPFNKIFYTLDGSSDISKFGQTIDFNGNLSPYRYKYNITNTFELNQGFESNIAETSWDTFKSKLYKKFIDGWKDNGYITDLRIIQRYNFETSNYIGVIKNSIKYIGSYFDGNELTLPYGRFSFTRGFEVDPQYNLSQQYKTALGDSAYNNSKDKFEMYYSPDMAIYGGNDVTKIKINQNEDFISNNIKFDGSRQYVSNLVGGAANASIDLLFSMMGLESGFKDSTLIFQNLAGYIYGYASANISFLGGITHKVSDISSELIGGRATDMLNNLANSQIQSALSNTMGELKKDLDWSSLMQLAQILLGDKYTKSYAFYDAELFKNGEYGIQSRAGTPNYNNIGFVGNRNSDSVTYSIEQTGQPPSMTNRLLNRFTNSIENVASPVTINKAEIKSDSLKDRLQIRSNGNAINLYNSGVGNDYKNTLLKQLDTKDKSIMENRHGKSRNNSVLSNTSDDNTDLIDFYFTIENISENPSDSKYIHFRADIKNIPHDISAEWDAKSYVGRPDKFYIYQGFERKSGVDFIIAADNKTQFKAMWDKVNILIGLCMPMKYSDNISMVPPIVKCKIGNYINNRFIIINSVSTNVDTSYPWDIDDQLPQIIDVSMAFTVLYDELPQTFLNKKTTNWHIHNSQVIK